MFAASGIYLCFLPMVWMASKLGHDYSAEVEQIEGNEKAKMWYAHIAQSSPHGKLGIFFGGCASLIAYIFLHGSVLKPDFCQEALQDLPCPSVPETLNLLSEEC